MKTNNDAYNVIINLNESEEKPLSFNWQQSEEPVFEEIVRKIMMYCMNNKLTNALMKYGAWVCVQNSYSKNKVADYFISTEQLQPQFFESIELGIG